MDLAKLQCSLKDHHYIAPGGSSWSEEKNRTANLTQEKDANHVWKVESRKVGISRLEVTSLVCGVPKCFPGYRHLCPFMCFESPVRKSLLCGTTRVVFCLLTGS